MHSDSHSSLENDFKPRQHCTIISPRRGGYIVILANGEEAFLHSQRQYSSGLQVEVMILQTTDRIVVTDEEKSVCTRGPIKLSWRKLTDTTQP